jgi:hypothetical protein
MTSQICSGCVQNVRVRTYNTDLSIAHCTRLDESIKPVSPKLLMGRDNVDGIAIYCGLNVLGIESWWGAKFGHPSRAALGSIQPPMQWVPGHSRGVNRPGRGFNNLRLSGTEPKERVKLYLYSVCVSLWQLVGELHFCLT